MAHSRRDFLRKTGFGALGAAALISDGGRFNLFNVFAQQAEAEATDYRALVSIFLFGGNDGNNVIVPYDQTAYNAYSTVRGTLAIPRDQLHQISPSNVGVPYGLHPNLSELHSLFQQQKIAVMNNVGTLVEPITKSQYRSGQQSLRPESLFSHSDQQQQWQTSVARDAGANAPTGWGGRTADHTEGLNGSTTFPMIVSPSGGNLFTTGERARPLVPSSGLAGFTTSAASTARYNAMQQLLASDNEATLVRTANEMMRTGIINTNTLNQALAAAAAVQTVFPNTGLGRQLQQVARIIAARSSLGLKRQIFSCSIGGFDTHNNQLATHVTLLTQLSQAMSAFYAATVELGVTTNVTTFTLSDFGRTLKPASGGGTDHAWGSHHFMMGGAVRGGMFYGAYPELTLNGPDDAGSEGRWIPTTSVDQYAATLATWYGLAPSDLTRVFPNINRFPTANLGFLM